MKALPRPFLRSLRLGFLLLLFPSTVAIGRTQIAVTNDPPFYGPYNALFLADGDGLHKPLLKDDSVLRADSSWTIYAWIKFEEVPKGTALIAGIGDPAEEFPRYLALNDGRASLWMGKDNAISSATNVLPSQWHFLAASFDGREFTLYSDGARVGAGTLDTGNVSPILEIAPPAPVSTGFRHFGGTIVSLTLLRRAISADEIKQLASSPADFANLEYEEGSKPWPVQTRGQAGYRAPQDPSTMPRSKAPASRPSAKPIRAQEILQANGDSEWTLAAGWSMIPSPKTTADGPAISQPGLDTREWLPATVPGTALTTMVDRGVYPDPDYGLNNLAIPETLNKQDYWYRIEFRLPKPARDRRLTLTFQGINYLATAWLNGQRIGSIKGAFIRGDFDVTGIVKADRPNVLAVRVSPPPHPGIPQEQSVKGGPGRMAESCASMAPPS